MQTDLKHRQLAFLLSLGALPIAGCVAGDDDDTTNATTMSTTVSTTDQTGTDGTDSNPSTTVNPSTTDNSSSGTEADTGVDSGSSTGDIEIPEVCAMYGAHMIECMAMYADTAAEYCAMYLQMDQMTYGAECVQADTDYYACLTMTDCAALMSGDPVCEAEQMAYEMACGGGATTGGSSGGSSSGG